MQKMLQLRLNDNYEKPVITLDECSQINCLFDTGSSMVVWCSTSESLLQIFRDAVPTGLKTLLSGFGGNGEFVDVYKIPFMSIASRGDAINFRNVHVAVLNRIRFGFDFDNHEKGAEENDFANKDSEWRDEVNALRLICENNGVSPLVERSQSGSSECQGKAVNGCRAALSRNDSEIRSCLLLLEKAVNGC